MSIEILGKIKNIWHSAVHIGVNDALDSRERRRVIYINYICMFLMVYATIRSMLSIQDPSYCLKIFALNFAVVGILILNHFHFYIAAKFYLFIAFNITVFIFSYFYLGGFHGGCFVVLLASVPWPYMLFDIKQKNNILICLAIFFISFTLLVVLQYVHPLPLNVRLNFEVVRISAVFLTIFTLLMLTWYFNASNAAAEEKLKREKEKSDAANQAKSLFLANMSHELRTPLNAILGFSELMKRDKYVTQKQLRNLEIIGHSGEHLLSLINNVLEFSKIEAGQFDLNHENFNFQDFLLGLEDMFRLKARQKNLSLHFHRETDVPGVICADQNKLRQILINLLGNAVKFTHHGQIRLNVRSQRADEKKEGKYRLFFEVADTGIGIAKKQHDKIFDAFFQATEQQTVHQGTGLGLPITQSYVHMMGGNMLVYSELGKGTTFSFDIPVEPIGADPIGPTASGGRVIGLTPGKQPPRQLVVEDNPLNRELLVKLLQEVGFEVREAVNGQEAIDVWKQWKPDVIWMDMRMPVMDGYEAANRIKGQTMGSDSDTVIIALTANAFETERRKALVKGCDDFIRKPFRENEIFEMLSIHLGVEFVYDAKEERKISSTAITDSDMHQAIDTLPETLRSEFKAAVDRVDFDKTVILLEGIQAENEALANALAEPVNGYQFDILQKLFKSV